MKKYPRVARNVELAVSVSDSGTSEAKGEVAGKRSNPPAALSVASRILHTSAPINKSILQQGLLFH